MYGGTCLTGLTAARAAVAAKAAAGGGGSKKKGRHAFYPRRFDPEDANRHENYILVSLYASERAWSHSMEIKALYDAPREARRAGGGSSKASKSPLHDSDRKRSAPSKIRRHYLRRLRRAAYFASQLEERCAASCDDRTVAEARAYASWMRGNVALEAGDYASAASEFGAALLLCQELGGMGGENEKEGVAKGFGALGKENLETRDFFSGRAEHVIEPLMRYCRYELQVSSNNTLQAKKWRGRD